MKAKLLLLALLSILVLQTAGAQDYGLWGGFGLQSSRMEDMKYYQQWNLNNWPVEGKITSSFPIYTTGSFGLVKQLNPTIRIGGGYSHSATGAKSNYTDYSGYVNTEILASSHRAGAFVSYSVLGGDLVELSAFAKIEVKYTSVEITTSYYALGYSERHSQKYISISPDGAAGLEFLLHLSSLSVGLEGAYEVDMPASLYVSDSKDDFLDPEDPDRVLTSEWTGWYAQVKFILWLN